MNVEVMGLRRFASETRTKLNAVIGFAEILLDGHAGSITTEQQDLLSAIRMSGKEILALVMALSEEDIIA